MVRFFAERDHSESAVNIAEREGWRGGWGEGDRQRQMFIPFFENANEIAIAPNCCGVVACSEQKLNMEFGNQTAANPQCVEPKLSMVDSFYIKEPLVC